MTADVNKYPHAVMAVTYHENPLLQKIIWPAVEKVVRASNKGDEVILRAMLAILRESADDVLRIVPEGPLATVRWEMDHPDFERYVRDKLRL